ncbi:ABC-2 type transport system permease protein [Actinomadura coerulea]|uniref:Transport permease protein n=1 Tax=Actinomadura coerulea TaxID=46159 RepID=A0A7X0FWL8_9ACTN|nr:ABC transporter permease [Actinomadura coerulea]MBB6395064.1 ABC-2 type transport system permease protein [Actinomadura coerulea]GGQ14537.1 transport permease protein [Actinomadura coerulea]
MTALTAPAPDSRAGRLRWALTDGLTLIGRELGRIRQEPGELIAALIFPAIMVVLFGYVFGSAISVPGGGNYREYLMPGLFAMVTFTSTMAVTMRVATDASRGVMDRFRSMPMARSAVPFGQTGAEILNGVLGMAIMATAGLVVGWRAHNGLWQTAEAFLLLALMRYALSWAGCYLGLVVKNEQAADQLIPLVFPITMLSNSFVPTAGMPKVLQVIAEWNPVSALTAACRELFGNPGAPAGDLAWPLAHPVPATIGWALVLLAVFAPLSVRTYRTRGR